MKLAEAVPKKLHSFWVNVGQTTHVPRDVLDAIESLRLSLDQYEHKLWHPQDVVELLTEFPEYAAIFRQVAIPAMQSDLARLVILYFHGGLYADATIIPVSEFTQTRFSELAGNHSLLVAESPRDPKVIMNCFIWARAKHPILKRVLDQAFANVENAINNRASIVDVWQLTGRILSDHINALQVLPEEVVRVDFATMRALFSRKDCAYKHTPIGNWQTLQQGKLISVFNPRI